MNDFLNQTIKRLIQEHGDYLYSDINRLRGMLYDACPSYKKEINVLISVVQADLITDLKRNELSVAYLHSLSNRLYNETGIDKALAEWGIKAWAEALRLGTAPKTKRRSRAWSGIVRPEDRKRAGGEPAAIKPYAHSVGNTAPVTSPVQASPAKQSHNFTGNTPGVIITSSQVKPTGDNWIWIISGLALMSLLVIIGYNIMLETTSPVVLSPSAPVDSVSPNNSDTRYAAEEIAKIVKTALQESVSLSKEIYKLRSNQIALKSAQDLNHLSPAYHKEVELLEGNIASLKTTTDKHFSGYVINVTLLDDHDASMVESILESTRTSISSNNEKVALELLRQHLRKYRSSHRIEDGGWRRDFEKATKQVLG